MMKVLVFGGTAEGARVVNALSENGCDVTLSVTTSYGGELWGNGKAAKILIGPLDETEMVSSLKNNGFDIVVDATHPYADRATLNIRRACEASDTICLRLLRSKGKRHDGVVYARNAGEAVEFLQRESGTVFLAIGSKELEAFTRLDRFADRCHVRILPLAESLQKAVGLGFRGSQIICMQGPFGVELNRAMLEATGAMFLVTKDSGEPGGIEEKITAATLCGCRTIVLERPTEETGFSFEALCDYFHVPSVREQKDEEKNVENGTFFPLFFNLHGKRILIVGGGTVARRRIGILHRFGAEIRIVSPDVTEELRETINRFGVSLEKRKFEPGDVAKVNPFLVIAATDCRETNEAVAVEAKKQGVPAIVSDRRERCDCYFPALAENETLLAGIVSKNGDHHAVRVMAERIRRLFNF